MKLVASAALLATSANAAALSASAMGCAATDDAKECAALQAIFDATSGPEWRQLSDPVGPVLKFDGSSYCTW